METLTMMTTTSQLTGKQVTHSDVLFLYRTKKKKRYFNLLKEQSLSTLSCHVQSYHGLPRAPSIVLPEPVLQGIVRKAELELYNAKAEAWQTVKVLSRTILVAQIKLMYSRLFHYLTENRPKLVAIWNGHKWQDNVFHAVNQHFAIPVSYFENGVLPKSTTMDFSGINALNSVPRDAHFYHAQISSDSESKIKIKGRKYKNRKDTKISFKRPKKYLLVPFQKDRDSQILDNSAWIKSMTQFFSVLLEALELSDRDDLHIVFREHPSAKTKYSSLYKLAAKHPRLCFDQQTELNEIISHAEAVITINSTVGLESLLLGTKVITLGEAFYNIESMVLRASSTQELTQQINALKDFSPDQHLLKAFIQFLQNDYVIPGDWKKPKALHYQTIQTRILKYLANLPQSNHSSSIQCNKSLALNLLPEKIA
jgi:capsular polysaccharide export protein